MFGFLKWADLQITTQAQLMTGVKAFYKRLTPIIYILIYTNIQILCTYLR